MTATAPTSPDARADQMEDAVEAAREYLIEAECENAARRFGRTVTNSFARGVGWTLGRDFVNGILSALGLRR
jgi:hypothetical protein